MTYNDELRRQRIKSLVEQAGYADGVLYRPRGWIRYALMFAIGMLTGGALAWAIDL